MKLLDVEHKSVAIDATGQHAYNQVNVRRLRSGRLVAVFNEERFAFHHDSGQTVLIVSDDEGNSWTDPAVVLAYTDTTGNWDCGICELADDTLLVNFTMAGYFKRGIRPEQPSWSMGPMSEQHGDWTWAYRTKSWLGAYTVRSTDGGGTWTDPIPVNARPLKHAGCRLGAWPAGGDSLLLGVYGRIRGYGEEGENESTRSALLRSDDGGVNWEYYSTMAYDAASIVDYEEPAIVKLADGRWVGMLRTHVNPSGDAKNMAIVISDDDGFSWSAPKFTNVWGYPAEFATLPDGRVLMIYGYRRPPYGVRGIVSEDGLRWDRADEFTIREGGVPQQFVDNPGIFQHIGYPSVAVLGDGSVLAMYHEYTDAERSIQYIAQTRFRLP
jgi:hypothetical protein